MSSLPIFLSSVDTTMNTPVDNISERDQDEIDIDNIEAILITDEPQEPTTTLTNEAKPKEKPTPKKQSCYNNGHFMSYVNKYRLQYNAYSTYDFYNVIIKVFKRIKHGGYNDDVYIKFDPQKNTTPLLINSIKCIGGCVDNTNTNFTHNFVELHYYGDKQYNNLVDIITPREFVKEFNGLVVKYNATIHKGLHYVNDEIKRLRKYNKSSTRAI